MNIKLNTLNLTNQEREAIALLVGRDGIASHATCKRWTEGIVNSALEEAVRELEETCDLMVSPLKEFGDG